MRRLSLSRHATSLSNALDAISCTPPGLGLSERGHDEARALGAALDGEPIDLAVSSELLRTQETVEGALGDREVPRLVLGSWNEIHFGRYEGGPLEPYREWAWTTPADVVCPGGGESRAAVALRVAATLDVLLARSEEVVLAVGHALPVRYVLDAAEGLTPTPRIAPVEHAVPHRIGADQVRRAAETLRRWGAAPRFAERPQA
jgi:probable phosphoglycerate mutase